MKIINVNKREYIEFEDEDNEINIIKQVFNFIKDYCMDLEKSELDLRCEKYNDDCIECWLEVFNNHKKYLC